MRRAGPAFLLLTALLAVGLVSAAPGAAQEVSEARAALRSGEYDEAVRDFRRILRDDPGSAEARRGLVRALATTGRLDEAEAAARAAPEAAALAAELGRVLEARGEIEAAEAAYLRAEEAGAGDALVARADRVELLFRTGRVEEALELADTFIDVYNGAGGRLGPAELLAVGRAVRLLGRTDPDLFQDALRAFDEAAAAAPGWGEPRIHLGELFLEKYQGPEATDELEAALAMNPRHPLALLAMARVQEFAGRPGAMERAREALEVNPALVEARAFLARIQLTRDEREEARTEAERAVEANPRSLAALTSLAAVHHLAGEEEAFRSMRRRALEINPRYAELDATVAELAERTRRYAAAVERARAAVALDSASWSAWGILGMNQLRTGRIDAGRASLERAFQGDPYNPWFKNNLDLLDTFDRFETLSTEHFELFLHGDEAELLGPMVAAFAEEAFDSMARRYGAEPPTPVRVELYPSHADFSVRTLGEVGLGALGVSFGPVLVMDSPEARDRSGYNWASTLWHELAHSFHLALTDHRVPRWFSEGLSVHEQRKGREGWGHQPTIPWLQAFRTGRLKPVSQLNDGFMRPEYPQQVIFSYYQASLVFQILEEEHGFQAVRDMLAGYRAGRTTEELFPEVLGISLEGFDDRFEAWVRERFDGALQAVAELEEVPPVQAGVEALEGYVRRHPGDLVARIRLGGALVEAERWDEAEPHLRHAAELFPEYGGPDSPWWYLARMHQARGEHAEAADALARLHARSEANLDALLLEAEVNRGLGRREAAVQALERALQVDPYDVDTHLALAELHGELENPEGVVRARAAMVALGPADRAQALYLLARAHRDAGSLDAARTTLLRALEIAPNYDDALELLLELRAGASDGAGG
jgi:tetratricopeptide (TPR) repeat protein